MNAMRTAALAKDDDVLKPNHEEKREREREKKNE